MVLLLLLLLPALAAAHFTLKAPSPVGPFDEDKESTAPCGGVNLHDASPANSSDFHVGGAAVAHFLSHPTGNWLYRATLDLNGAADWVQIYPLFTQTGVGDFCQPAVAAPSEFAGQRGVLGVVVDGPDGLLYQCAVVNFVEGSGTYSASTCSNASSVSAAFASDASLSHLVSQDMSQTNGTSTEEGSSTASTGTPNSTPAPSVASELVTPMMGVVGSLAAVLVASLVGVGLMV